MSPQRQPLPHYSDWLRGAPEPLWCDVMSVSPPLRLPWAYTPAQEEEGDVWTVNEVWLHSAALANGTAYAADVHEDLRQALTHLRDNVTSAKYTLLVNPDGMKYDMQRLGGDHQVAAGARRFTLSVRRGEQPGQKLLLAIAWD